MTPNPPDIGHAYFYDEINPPLDVGQYELHVNQHVSGISEVPAQNMGGTSVDKFEITGPRFRLNPADIHSLYPPPNIQGPFYGRLPQVVLTRRTLPWERSLGPDVPAAHRKAPWLAVLLLEESEVTLLDKATVGGIVNHNKSLSNYKPLALTNAEKEMSCLGIEITLNRFQQIAPMLNELKWLTHGRQVNTDDKELLGQDDDGWFAVVVGNRLPQPSRKYVACLVSLEGLWDLLPEDVGHTNKHSTPPVVVGPGGIGTIGTIGTVGTVGTVGTGVLTGEFMPIGEFDVSEGDQPLVSPAAIGSRAIEFTLEQYLFPGVTLTPYVPKIQLITLARWQFETNDTPGTFQSLTEDLPVKGGVAMLGANQDSATLPDAVEGQPAYQVALDSGHVPLKHVTREGKTTVAWYRGPLTPIGVKHDKNAGPYHTSDQARRIDALTGFENLGYASAFELGRLMALADPRFAVELLRWRRDAHTRVASRIQIHTATLLQDAIQTVLNKLVHPYDLLHSGLLGELVNQIYIDFGISKLIQPADFTGFGGVESRLPGLDPNATLTLPDESTVQIGELIGASLSLEGATLPAFNTLELETNLNTLTENAAEEFAHLQNAFRGQFDSDFGGGA